MKKILILLVALSLTSCHTFDTNEQRKANLETKYGKCVFKLEIEYITGTIEHVSYTLPKSSNLYVETNRGSYELVNSINDKKYGYYFNRLKAGVVRYKLLSKTCE